MKTKIKNSVLTGLIVLSSFISANTTLEKEPETCLTVSGKVLATNTKEKICAYLIQENAIIDSLQIHPNVNFAFSLKRNLEYSVKIVHKGYADRLIYISTRLPSNLKGNPLFEFHFDLIPFKPDTFANKDALDFPVALIYYQSNKRCFDYNKKYTSFIKKEFKQPVFNE